MLAITKFYTEFLLFSSNNNTAEHKSQNNNGGFSWNINQMSSVTVTVTNVKLTSEMGMQLILPITVPVKKIKGDACQHYSDGDEWFSVNEP